MATSTYCRHHAECCTMVDRRGQFTAAGLHQADITWHRPVNKTSLEAPINSAQMQTFKTTQTNHQQIPSFTLPSGLSSVVQWLSCSLRKPGEQKAIDSIQWQCEVLPSHSNVKTCWESVNPTSTLMRLDTINQVYITMQRKKQYYKSITLNPAFQPIQSN